MCNYLPFRITKRDVLDSHSFVLVRKTTNAFPFNECTVKSLHLRICVLAKTQTRLVAFALIEDTDQRMYRHIALNEGIDEPFIRHI